MIPLALVHETGSPVGQSVILGWYGDDANPMLLITTVTTVCSTAVLST